MWNFLIYKANKCLCFCWNKHGSYFLWLSNLFNGNLWIFITGQRPLLLVWGDLHILKYPSWLLCLYSAMCLSLPARLITAWFNISIIQRTTIKSPWTEILNLWLENTLIKQILYLECLNFVLICLFFHEATVI